MPKKKPANANVPTSWKGQDRLFGEKIKENVDVLTGVRGDPLDRAITARDLVDSNIAKIPKGNTTFTGSSSGLEPVATSAATNTNLDPIPAPTNLQTAGAFQAILLTWDLSQYAGHAFVQLHRHTSDDVANATMIAQVSGYTGIYSDLVGGGASFYYWVKAVNTNGESGPFNSSSGTQGTTNTDVSVLLTALNNAITTSELATDLSTPIGEISGIQDDVTAVETAIANLKNTPAWAVSTGYVVGDLVSYSSNLYSALTAHTSTAGNAPDTTPQNSTEWQHIGAYGSIVDVLAQTESTRATLISDYITTADSDSAIASAKTELRSAVYQNALGVPLWSSGTTYTFSASNLQRVNFGDKIYNLLQNSTNNQPDTSSSYWAEDTVASESSISQTYITSADSASNLASAVLALESTTNLSNYKTTSAINTDHYTKTDADSAASGQIATATSGLTNPDGSSSTVTLQQAMTTQADVNGGLKGQYTVKINGNDHIAGFGLASTTASSGANTSEFFVQADRFAVMPPPPTASTANQPELVTNGTFAGTSPYNGDVSNFTAAEGTIVAYYTTARITDDGGPDVYAYQAITTTIGDTYRCTGNMYYGTGAGRIAISSSTSVSDIYAFSATQSSNQSTASLSFDFTATSTTTYVVLQMVYGNNTNYCTYDNISCKRLVSVTNAWSVGTYYPTGTQVKFSGLSGTDTEAIYRSRYSHYSSSTSTSPLSASYWDKISGVPFTIQTSSQVINGTTVPAGVYMDAAFIKNGSITTAQIGNATVDILNVTGDLSADRIVGGSIDTSLLNIDGSTITTNATGALEVGSITIDSADITDGSITDAKIGGAIQSTDFVAQDNTTNPVTAGVGWKIDKDGEAEFTNATFRGSLEAATGSIGSVTIADSGNIKSGQTSYDQGTGFFLGDVNGTTKFSIGSSSSSLTWDGSSLVLKNAQQNFTAGNNPLVVSARQSGWYNTSGWVIIKSITVAFDGTVRVKASGYKTITGNVFMGVGRYLSFGNPSHGDVNLPYNSNSQVINTTMTVSAGDVVHLYGDAAGNNFGPVGFNTSFGLYISEQPPVPAVVTLDP